MIAFVLLAIPLAVGVSGRDEAAKVLAEGRTPAAAPSIWAAGIDLPRKVDAYLKDRFGLRREMIRLALQMDNLLPNSGNGRVLVGRDGRMYTEDDEAVRQSAGLVMRDRSVRRTAEYLAAKQDALARRGIRFLVASPPNTATIYTEELPSWARNNGKATEYDLLLAELSKRGVRAIDLRPVLRAARTEGEAYLRHDSHWAPRGALAAFNAIAEADGHPDWRMSAAEVLGSPTILRGGDLAKFIGVQNDVTEPVQALTLPGGSGDKWTSRAYTAFAKTGDQPTGTVMVLGDSFTASLFPPLLLAHVRKVVWAHHDQCDFDWQAIDRYRPDEVWWMPTERSLNCMPRALPADSSG